MYHICIYTYIYICDTRAYMYIEMSMYRIVCVCLRTSICRDAVKHVTHMIMMGPSMYFWCLLDATASVSNGMNLIIPRNRDFQLLSSCYPKLLGGFNPLRSADVIREPLHFYASENMAYITHQPISSLVMLVDSIRSTCQVVESPCYMAKIPSLWVKIMVKLSLILDVSSPPTYSNLMVTLQLN